MRENSIGENLKKLRREKGMSQAALANALNVKQTCISLWESGRNNINAEALQMICYVLDVSVDQLFGKEQLREEEIIYDQREQLLIEYYRKIGIEEQNAILSVLKRLADASVSK